MKTIIVSYKVNRFTPYIIFWVLGLSILIYGIIKGNQNLEPIWIYGMIAFSIKILLDILWLLFGVIQLTTDKENLTIEKRLFDIKYYSKKIKKPFNVELIKELKSDYYLSQSYFDWFTFYHKNGLRFIDNNEEIIYEVGLNNNLDENSVYDKIK